LTTVPDDGARDQGKPLGERRPPRGFIDRQTGTVTLAPRTRRVTVVLRPAAAG